jgi:hypothetical protein
MVACLSRASFIDPFGAPEYLVDDLTFRQMVGTEYMRLGYHTDEEDSRILRVKIVFPIVRLLTMQADTQLFIAHQGREGMRMAS